MSYSTMEALSGGRVVSWGRRSIHAPERKTLEEKTENKTRCFIEKMSLDECRRFQQLENLFLQAAFDDEADIYPHSFTLSALLMTEITIKKEAIRNA